jgi:hypothetical protein
MQRTLSDQELKAIDAYWRAANFLSVAVGEPEPFRSHPAASLDIKLPARFARASLRVARKS